MSESKSKKSFLVSLSVSGIGNAFPGFKGVFDVPFLSSYGSNASAKPSESTSFAVPVPYLPSPSGSIPPASIASTIPSLSESRSKKSL